MSAARKQVRWVGGSLAAVGFALLFVGLVRSGLIQLVGAELGASPVGAGPFLGALLGLLSVFQFEHLTTMLRLSLSQAELGNALAWNLLPGLVLWLAGWGALSFGLGSEAVVEAAPSEAVGRPLFPRLANTRDFNWGTLAAYGFGVLFAELAFIGAYMVLVGTASSPGSEVRNGMSPVWAFVLAFFVSLLIAFSGGFGGASNAQRLATPEATIALIYFGMPVPLVLSAMHHVPELMTSLGYRLREVVYLSSLLGETRPELGYWLVFAGIALALFLGIDFGFVSTGSGKLDLRASYELFISARHVSVFRPQLLLGAFTVLILGIVPPLIIYAIVSAAEAAAERTRIRRLGMKDPLEAARALHELKLKAQTPTAMMTALSVGGVGVGVMALIIVLSVMSGFEADLQKKILGTNAHGVVMKFSLEMPEYDEVMEKLGGVRGIVGRTPFILNEVMIAAEGNISGSMIKGIDPKTVGSVTDLPEYMLPGGSLEGLDDPTTIKHKSLTKSLKDAALDERPAEPKKDDILRDPMIEVAEDGEATVLPGLVLGRELAASLKVVVGDAIQVVSPIGGELGPQGPTPKSRAFRVAGIFYSGMYEYDSKFVYIHLREAQSFFGVKGASGIEVKVDDVDNARGVMKRAYDKLEGFPYRTKDWGEMNHNLFAALRLEKLVMGIILSIIVIVAAGLIVATVIMLVLEKRKEIAVLKALGVPDGGIVKIFLAEGLQIGVAGGLLGLIAGLAWCLFIEKFGIKLDPQVYYIPSLPVKIEPFQTVLSVVIAILITFLASIYPALKASQVEPVDGLKSE